MFRLGLGELTFLQLSTTYSPPSIAGYSVGYIPHRLNMHKVDGFALGTLPQVLALRGLLVRSCGGRYGAWGFGSVSECLLYVSLDAIEPITAHIFTFPSPAHAICYTPDILLPTPQYLFFPLPDDADGI